MSGLAYIRPHLQGLLRNAPSLTSWGLALALLVQSTFVYEDLLGAERRSHTSAAVAVAQQTHTSRTSVIRIADAHLFGIPATGAAAADDVVKEPTHAALVLTGIVAGGRFGGAIIGETPQKTRFVRVGAEIVPGIMLRTVYSDRVILERAGSLEFLALPRASGAAAPVVRMESVADSNPSPPGQDLEAIKKATASAAEHLAPLFEATPLIDGTLYRGIKIKPGPDAELFARMGFEPGDVITHVNGAPIDDPAALDIIATGRPVRVSVRRPEGIVSVELNRDSSSLR